MNRQEAQFLLQAYRKGQGLSELADLKEALQLLETDSELQTWFEEEKAFDDAFGSLLSEVEAPADLLPRILSNETQAGGTVEAFPWWKQFSIIGAAASVLLVLGLLMLPNNHAVSENNLSIASLQSFANQSLKDQVPYDNQASEWGELVAYLDNHGTPAPSDMPDQVVETKTSGCNKLKLMDKPVGLICFGENADSHLFVMNSEDFPELPYQSSPVLEKENETSTVYWSKDGRHYLLLTYNSEELAKFVLF